MGRIDQPPRRLAEGTVKHVIFDDEHIAAAALTAHDVAPESELTLLNLSENATYALTDAATGMQSVVRVHRNGYHQRHQIESELDWLDALRSDTGVAVPVVIKARDGQRVVTVNVEGAPRHVVRFEMVAGAHPEETDVTDADFHTLGRITAALHQHSHTWRRPPAFDRFAWDWEHSLGSRPRWGRWQVSAGVGDQERRILHAAQDLIRRRLIEYGQGPERYGLVHADLRLANLLVDAGNVTVIDFDDSGFGWFFYDFGAAVSFLEDDPAVPGWQAAWLDGYRTVGSLRAGDEDMMASFVLLRRLLLLAWMGTHSHSLEAQTKLITYADGSCTLADRYLSSAGLSLF
jgi:Ser/Thr protein kinase RdoA (MazF antagonist)